MQYVMINRQMVPVDVRDERFFGEGAWQMILKFQPFRDYCARMDPRLKVEKITIKSVDLFRSGIGFMHLVASIKDEKGDWVPGTVFLRGPSVVMLVILCDERKNKYVALVQQARPAVGRSDLLEVPAGTLDGFGKPRSKAVEELEQELKIIINPDELVDLTVLAFGEDCPGIYPSPGASDETFKIFVCRKDMSASDINALNGQFAGLRGEGERIRIKTMPMDKAKRSLSDAKARLAIGLYQDYQDEADKCLKIREELNRCKK